MSLPSLDLERSPGNVAVTMRAAFHFQNCSAIITGASSGLGAEFARQLAPDAACLILAARRLEALEEVRRELIAIKPSLQVLVFACDISTDDGRARLVEMVSSMEMETKPNLLINNAGAGDYGTFASSQAERTRGLIDLNVTAVAMLSHALLPLMQRSADAPAGILNVSSLAGTLPMPDLAIYAATKAFVTSFTEALRVELADEHVIVSAVCPGPTPTNFGKNARRGDGTDTNRSGQGLIRIQPQTVVRCALDALVNGKACVYPGVSVTLASVVFRVMPRRLMRWVMERRFRASH